MKKYIARKYTAIKQYYEKMEQLHQEGYSYYEIGEIFEFTKEQIKECVRRPRRKAQNSRKYSKASCKASKAITIYPVSIRK